MTQSVAGTTDRAAIERMIDRALAEQPVVDMHTHLYPPTFGTPDAGVRSRGGRGGGDPDGLMLWGIDELLTYHYLIAELFRVVGPARLTTDQFWAMNKRQQAELIWRELFLERSPISEACRGVLTTLQRLGLDPAERDLDACRAFFAEQESSEQIDRAMRLAGVESITMTNNVFDDNERRRWLDDLSVGDDPRFEPVLRFDALLTDWEGTAVPRLSAWGYDVREEPDERTIAEVRRFLDEWLNRTKAIYAAVSLPPGFRYPADTHGARQYKAGAQVLTDAVLPACRERALAFAMMIGSERQVNPALRAAGDMGFRSDVGSVVRLCREFPDNKFFATMLSREDQHELAVAARKFGNLMVFGCWWFLNNPSLIEEITRMRCELLGTSFIPQHSDCRVLEQLIYKWDHSRAVIGKVLADKYADLAATGWDVREEEIRRDVRRLLRDNFVEFLER